MSNAVLQFNSTIRIRWKATSIRTWPFQISRQNHCLYLRKNMNLKVPKHSGNNFWVWSIISKSFMCRSKMWANLAQYLIWVNNCSFFSRFCSFYSFFAQILLNIVWESSQDNFLYQLDTEMWNTNNMRLHRRAQAYTIINTAW